LVVSIIFCALSVILSSRHVSSYMVHNYFGGGEWIVPVMFSAGIGVMAFLVQGIIYAAAFCAWFAKKVDGDKYFKCNECGASIIEKTLRCPVCGKDVNQVAAVREPAIEQHPMREIFGLNKLLKNKYVSSNFGLIMIPVVIISIAFFLPIFIYPFVLPIMGILLFAYIIWVINNYRAANTIKKIQDK